MLSPKFQSDGRVVSAQHLHTNRRLSFARVRSQSAKAICAAKAKMRYTVGSGLPVAVANVCLRPVAIANQYLRKDQNRAVRLERTLRWRSLAVPVPQPCPAPGPFAVFVVALSWFSRPPAAPLWSAQLFWHPVLAPWSGTLIRHAVPAPWPGTLVWPFAVLRWSLFVAVSWSPCRAVTYRELRREEN